MNRRAKFGKKTRFLKAKDKQHMCQTKYLSSLHTSGGGKVKTKDEKLKRKEKYLSESFVATIEDCRFCIHKALVCRVAMVVGSSISLVNYF